MKKIFSILTAIGLSIQLFGQNDVDALRYSQLSFGGTARGMGLSGAFGALGADFTSLSVNPAGLGLYRTSEFLFTPAIVSSKTTSDFIGNSSTDRKYNFNFTNWGFVVTDLDEKSGDKKPKWVSYSFAFGANRLVSFHNKIFFQGYNAKNSLLDKYIEELNAGSGTLSSDLDEKNKFPFSGALAYWAYLINPVQINDSTWSDNQYVSVISDGEIFQSGTITTKGAIDEYDISFGANYNNKLSLGGTLGLPYIHYKQNYDYTEEDINDSIPDFNSFTISDQLTTKGMGANLKIGAIYRPDDWIRLGAAIHTPTFYSLKDNFSTQIYSDFATPKQAVEETKLYSDGAFEYNLTTPWRVIGSVALIYKKLGFISVDYEWLDYGQANYNFNRADAADKFEGNQINKDIETKYGSASNIRIGAEVSVDVFRIRGGYAMYGTPFKTDKSMFANQNSRNSISFGLGVREENYFIDFAFVKTMSKEYYSPYQLTYEATEGTTNKISQNNFVLTMGIKF